MASRDVRFFIAIAAVLVATFFIPQTVSAGPADPTPFVVRQPDGSSFVARMVGDEHANARETLTGFTVIRDSVTGFWVYAGKNPAGRLVPTPLVVGRNPPAGLAPRLRPSVSAAPGFERVPAASAAAAPALGNRRLLVLLVQFADKAASTTAAAWQALMFGPTSSVRDHYAASSYGQLTIAAATESEGTANDGVVGWLTLPSNHPNTSESIGSANQQLTRDAIVAADPFVNFALFDTNGNGRLTPDELMIVVVAAGNEASYFSACSPSVWAHQSSVPAMMAPAVDGVTAGADGYAQFGEMHCATMTPPGQIATFGVIAHEIGHLFALPDLYDVDGSSNGIGDWSLMSLGAWNGLGRQGDSPALLDAWSKTFLGWSWPTLVSGTLTNQSIPQAATNNVVFQLLNGSAASGTGEYFLVENRQKVGYDAALPGAGLLIWHIEESRTNNTAECIPGGSPACSDTVHFKVALVEADGFCHLEHGLNAGDSGDPFPGASSKMAFNDATSPSSRLWGGAATSAAVADISASGATMTATLTVANAAPAVFEKQSPANGVTGLATSSALGWGTSAGASSYEYCIDTTNDGTCSAWTSIGTSTTAGVASLAPGTTYWWQVRATNTNGVAYANGSSSAFWSFTTSIDQFEPDDAPGQAGLLLGNAPPQSRSFNASGDTDWVRFWAIAGRTYAIFTTNLGAGVDTQLFLYSDNGITLVQSDDNGGGGLSSRIVMTAASTGTYYARVVLTGGAGAGAYAIGLDAAVPLRADFNGDGRADIVWQHADGSTAAWLMDGLTLSSGGGFIGAGTGWTIRQLADFNGDGMTDIVWQHNDGRTNLWLMNGLTLTSGGPLVGAGTGWSVAHVGDFDGDGRKDILWQHTDGSTAIWLMNGLTLMAGSGLIGAGTGWNAIQVADFNGDGKSDILWQHSDGCTVMWLMNGLGILSGGTMVSAGSGWNVRQVGDFNGDGKSDIVWQHADGAAVLWLMDGRILLSGGPLVGSGSGWYVVQAGDFNGDGRSDIVWQHPDGTVIVWLMNGLTLMSGGTMLSAGSGWNVREAGDFNGDGKRDFLWRHTNGSSAMWLMNGVILTSGSGMLGPATGWSPVP